MHKILLKFSNLYAKSGLILFILRLPIRTFKVARNQVSTSYWKLFLKKTGKGIFIEYGVNIANPMQVTIGDNVYIGSGTEFGSETLNGKIIIHDNVHIGRNCTIDHSGEVTLEEGVLLSGGVTIYSHSHGYNPKNKPTQETLIICRNSWIGNNTMILEKSNKIAEGVIIGAGSIVTKPCIEKHSIYAGSPAIFKKYIP